MAFTLFIVSSDMVFSNESPDLLMFIFFACPKKTNQKKRPLFEGIFERSSKPSGEKDFSSKKYGLKTKVRH